MKQGLLSLSDWITLNIIAVDIETETTASRDYPEILHSIKEFGLSALSPITDVALYAPSLGTLHLDMRGFNPYRQTCSAEARANWQFLRKVLCRTGLTIVGHNVVFDLRGLGVQYNAFRNQDLGRSKKNLGQFWEVPVGSKVWDTAIIAKRMLLGEQFSDKSPFFDKFSLLDLGDRLGVQLDPDLLAMVEWMKTQRANLSELESTLLGLPAVHEVWSYLGGYVPPNRKDLLEDAGRKLLADYVGMDAKIAYEIYEKELSLAQQLAEADVRFGKFKLMKYPELLHGDTRPEFEGHLDFWTRALRLNANRAVRGLHLNRRYVKERKTEFKQKVKTSEELIMGAKDPHEPYADFEQIASQFVYFEMLLNKFDNSKQTYNQHVAKEWVFWKPVQVYPALLREALNFHPSLSEKEQDAWMDFLKADPYATFLLAKQAAPATRAPKLDLAAWIKRNCYAEYAEPLASLLAKTKADWFREFYTTRRADLKAIAWKYWDKHPHKAPEDREDESFWFRRGEREFYRKMSNSKKWVPYYLYCVAGAPLPSSDALRFGDGLTTNDFRKRLAAYKGNHKGQEPEDFQVFVVNCHLEKQAFSYGKGAIDFFLTDPDYEESLKPLRDLIQYRAYVTRFAELEQHAFLDGCVHSLIIPDAKTTRGASTNPNLQNVAMATKNLAYPSPYPGVFVAKNSRKNYLGSIDYSNAEINMGNMIARDDAGAEATVDADYHAKMAATYWPDRWANEPDNRKAIRNASKSITFSIPYGAGVYKVARMMQSDVKSAKELLDNRKRLLWRTEQQKKAVEENARKRMNASYLPVFVQLWSKERVQIDRTNYDHQIDILAYPAWNYLQQGGVTALIRRADVIISEWLETNGYKSFVQQDIHDELLFCWNIEEYLADDRALPTKVLQIMNNIVPEEFLERTTPKTHFIAEFGPENKNKWGYHPYAPYPFPLDEFITQWGRIALPAGAKEAPSWPGPKHLGWTLQQETEALQAKRAAQSALDGEDIGRLETGMEWFDLQSLFYTIDLGSLSVETRSFILKLQQPMEFVYEDKDGKLKRSGALPFSAWMIASRELYHRGKPTMYRDVLCKVRHVLQTLEAGQAWLSQYQNLFEVLKETA